MGRGTAIVDLTNCKTWGEMFFKIKRGMDFPDFCGENWSALWDSLFSYTKHTRVIVKGTDTVVPELKPYVAKMLEIFRKFKEECDRFNWEFEYEVINGDGE